MKKEPIFDELVRTIIKYKKLGYSNFRCRPCVDFPITTLATFYAVCVDFRTDRKLKYVAVSLGNKKEMNRIVKLVSKYLVDFK
jgi:hypothetical protein